MVLGQGKKKPRRDREDEGQSRPGWWSEEDKVKIESDVEADQG